jgi:CHASE3 domain sensor protein
MKMTREKYFKDLKKRIDEIYLDFHKSGKEKLVELEEIKKILLDESVRDEYYEDLKKYIEIKLESIGVL